MTASRPKLNMSDFLAGLNTSPTVTEQQDDFNQLDVFATADFFNFDLQENEKRSEPIESLQWNNMSNNDLIANDFQFDTLLSGSAQTDTTSPSFPLDTTLFTQNPAGSQAGVKRKLELLDPNLDPQGRARVEADEDKRRRNTAASARFRVKKKQREQALEKSAKEMTDKATRLEKRVHELEMENKWLKGLLTEKTGGLEFGDLFAKYLAENGEEQSEDDGKSSKKTSAI